MPDTASVARSITAAETAADDAAALAERMRALGAWGAYSAMQKLARERGARAERVRTMWRHRIDAGARVEQAATLPPLTGDVPS